MNKRVFRFSLLLLTLAALLAGCSFSLTDPEISEIVHASDPEHPTSDTAEKDHVFALAYYTEEALDPFTAASRTNSELLRLCYSGLFSVDAKYNAVPVLTDLWEVNGNSVVIRLKNGIRFSDGSPVTAADCVASYRRAAEKNSLWNGIFSHIRSYEATDDGAFRITFRKYTPTQLNLLTVPIVKKDGTDAAGHPIGCGRYAFSAQDAQTLVRADCGCIPGNYAIEKITLLGIADEEAMIYNFNYGRLQAVCAKLTEGTGEYRSDNEIVSIPSNRFTFLAVNKTLPLRAPAVPTGIASPSFSKGLNLLLDRAALTDAALHSHGTGVWYPLNPAWEVTEKAELNPSITDLTAANDAFTAAGFELSGAERTLKGVPVILRLLVNRESSVHIVAAEEIAKQLNSAGFTTEILSLAWDEYAAAIDAGEYDLYLGEVNLPANLDLSVLFSGQVCRTGEEPGTYAALEQKAAALLTGEQDTRDFVNSFTAELPFIPLYYAADGIVVSMDISGQFGSSVSEFYAGIENWELK